MFSRLLNIGVTGDLEFYQKKETKILNLFALITLTGLLIGTTNILFLGKSYPFTTIILETIASILILVFNHKKLYQVSLYLFVLSMNMCLLYISVYYKSSTGSYLYYFPVIFCIALLHNPNKSKMRDVIFFSIIALSFFCTRFIHIPFIGKADLNDDQNQIIFNYNINLCAVLTIVLVYLIINLINKQNLELTEVLKTIQNDQVTIKNSLQEKEVLLAEIQHRVKNNLAIIIGLFNLQKNNASNEEVKQSINEAKNRVLSIAMVHERLYKKEDLSHINLKYYISELIKEIVRSFPSGDKVTIFEELENIDANITKAVPIGLIVNEVITNSLKHAFADSIIKPVIKISLTTHFDVISIKMQDNGIGFANIKHRDEKSLGLTLIESLAEQIDGNIHYNNNDGACVKLSFPVLR